MKGACRDSAVPTAGSSPGAPVATEAEAILAAIEIRIGLAEVTETGLGEPMRQPVMESAFKQATTDALGLVLWKQWGFVTRLPPREYVSVTELSRPVFFEDEFRWTVSVLIK